MSQKKPFLSRDPNEKLEKAYAFFSQMEDSGEYFDMDAICKATGYSLTTAEGHRDKKWRHWFLHEQEGKGYYCKGLYLYPKSHFIAIHSQTWRPYVAAVPQPAGSVRQSHTKNGLLLWLFLLMVIAAWYRISRRWRMRVWHIWWPLAS